MKIKQKFKNTNYLPKNNLISIIARNEEIQAVQTKKHAKTSFLNEK